MDIAKKIVISSLFFLTNVNAVGYQMEYSNEFKIRLKEEIIADEGTVLKVYRDHLGYFTVGIGHLITPKDQNCRQEGWGTFTGRYRTPYPKPLPSERVRGN